MAKRRFRFLVLLQYLNFIPQVKTLCPRGGGKCFWSLVTFLHFQISNSLTNLYHFRCLLFHLINKNDNNSILTAGLLGGMASQTAHSEREESVRMFSEKTVSKQVSRGIWRTHPSRSRSPASHHVKGKSLPPRAAHMRSLSPCEDSDLANPISSVLSRAIFKTLQHCVLLSTENCPPFSLILLSQTQNKLEE